MKRRTKKRPVLGLTAEEVFAVNDALDGRSYAVSPHFRGWDSAMRKTERYVKGRKR